MTTMGAPVPFIEGIRVKAEFSRHGLGNQLLAHIEAFLAAQGQSVGSDTQIDNGASQAPITVGVV